MTREEIAQIHKALQESSANLLGLLELLKHHCDLPSTEIEINRLSKDNKAAMDILSKYYQSSDKSNPLDVEI